MTTMNLGKSVMADKSEDSCVVENLNANFTVNGVNLDALKLYKDNGDLVYDGKRLKW